MKATKEYRMSKSTKRMIAGMASGEKAAFFKTQMIRAEVFERSVDRVTFDKSATNQSGKAIND
jgi:hypothetical protein